MAKYPNGFKHVEMKDHEMAKWLRDQDPNWTWTTYEKPAVNEFIANGKVVAVIFYDNSKCTRKIYIR